MDKRKPNRLEYYNYSNCGYYYVTICVEQRESVLGDINSEGVLNNSEIGKIAEKILVNTNSVYDNVSIDSYVIMPNHVHAIIIINDKSINSENKRNQNKLSSVVSAFKSISTRKTGGLLKWQKSFYDHIIRNEEEFKNIREYISNNPINWTIDENNPNAEKQEPDQPGV